ncbi:MAG TPA: hypothetical protein VM889_06070 [Candidatus Thermoplasmatota archaeon]|nr:hypothetical protein [Candidatus Thermoplasmatota archaeon]
MLQADCGNCLHWMGRCTQHRILPPGKLTCDFYQINGQFKRAIISTMLQDEKFVLPVKLAGSKRRS